MEEMLVERNRRCINELIDKINKQGEAIKILSNRIENIIDVYNEKFKFLFLIINPLIRDIPLVDKESILEYLKLHEQTTLKLKEKENG